MLENLAVRADGSVLVVASPQRQLWYAPAPSDHLPLDLEFRRGRVRSKGGAPVSGPRAPTEADACPETGRGRLSYPRAEYLFKQATAAHDPHKQGWTLHQLRHSALQHLAANGRTLADESPCRPTRRRPQPPHSPPAS